MIYGRLVSKLGASARPRRRMNMIGHSVPQKREQAFTLIELLVVMAITVILLGLIFGPLVQSFNLTNRARVQIETQDVARRVMEIASRDLANGVFVFDNSTEPIYLWIRTPNANGDPLGPPVPTALPFAQVDLVPPARLIDQDAAVQPQDIDPTTGLPRSFNAEIDQPNDPRFKVALPLAPGRTIVRYFLALRDNTSEADPTTLTSGRPLKPYTNFYDNPSIASLSVHNPVILYRAVISPYLPDGRVDERFFRRDAAGRPILYDPNFFYDYTDAPAGLPAIPGYSGPNARGYGRLYENWKLIARAVVPTDRADEVIVQRGGDGKPIYYPDPVTGPYMRITPLVRLQPTYMGNDAGAATSTRDPGNESPDVAPSTHRETYGHWTTPHRFFIYRNRLNTNPLPVFFWYNTGAIDDEVMAQEVDIATGTVNSSVEAFWFPNWRPLLLNPQTGRQVPPPNSSKGTPNNVPLVMFSTDARKGIINYAFPDSIMLHDGTGKPDPSQFDPAVINQQYEAYRIANPTNISNALRYVDLKQLPNGRQSPLNVIPNCRIVPGSEVVIGPDMRPGPNYGKPVIYTRRPRTDYGGQDALGPNEYMINYSDVPNANLADLDPMNRALMSAGTIIFRSKFDEPYSLRPPVAVQQHGFWEFALPEYQGDANGNLTLPAAPIIVTYQIQNNLPIFSVRGDYLTRELMTFALGVRLYEFNSGQPQQVTLTRKVKVQNLQR
jgi:prepilin-type N-terminal cleavage/methylation domain-containing protein